MLEPILFFLWMGAMVVACVPPVGRWVYIRGVSYLERLKTSVDDNLFD